MNTHQIMLCLSEDRLTRDAFRGVFAKDLLLKHGRVISGKDNSFVCNTADSRNSGEHWTAIYIDRDARGEYFDSYGFAPNEVFTDFLEKYCIEWTFNTTPLQSPLTTVCGQYCIFWLHGKGQSVKSDDIVEKLNVPDSDRIVLNFVNKHYSGITSSRLVDRRFMKDQISKSRSALNDHKSQV